jgi:serine/threonine-protein kinase
MPPDLNTSKKLILKRAAIMNPAVEQQRDIRKFFVTTPHITEVGSTVRLNTSADTRLHGSRLLVARLLWLTLTLLAAGTFVIAVPVYHQQVGTVAADGAPNNFHLTVADQTALTQFGLSPQSFALLFTALPVIAGVIVIFISLLIFLRKSNDGVAIVTSLTFMLIGTYAGLQHTLPTVLEAWEPVWYRLVHFLFGVDLFLLALFLGVFPNGQFVPARIRWLLVIPALLPLMPVFFPVSVLDYNAWPPLVFLLYVTVVYNGLFYSQVIHYRRASSAIQRQQTKWAVVGSVGAFLLTIVPAVLVFAILSPDQSVLYRLTLQFVVAVAKIIIATSVSFAIFRYRLWDIDLVVNRSLVYGSLTIVLGLVFAGSAFAIQLIFQTLIGGMQSPVALAISAVVIGSLFQPARRRLQRFVDLRFYHLRVELRQFDATPPGIANPGLLTGRQFGPYHILEPLGRGGMSEVYKGFHDTLNRTVAIKILPPSLADETDFRTRFEREARIVAGLRHPNIVHVFDFGAMDNTYYMVMEFVAGEDLAAYLRRCGPLPLAQAQPILAEIAAALDYAHEHHLVHRDVKPANVMLQPAIPAADNPHPYRAILTDFGVARVMSSSTGLTKTGAIGTLDYMAPEQIVSAKAVDGRADIYALGVMAYQMLTGQVPFKNENVGATVFAHLQRPAPDARDLAPDVPAGAAKAIQQAMAKRPEDRFQTAGAFTEALGAAWAQA